MVSSTNAHSIRKLAAPARTNATISLSTMLLGEELQQVQGDAGEQWSAACSTRLMGTLGLSPLLHHHDKRDDIVGRRSAMPKPLAQNVERAERARTIGYKGWLLSFWSQQSAAQTHGFTSEACSSLMA